MTTPTHDLALARAERDAWQSTCEELHRTIAGRDVEIEAHLGRCDAADQRARSFDAALTAEREASKGLVAQVEALRAEAATACANLNRCDDERASAIGERDAAIARAEKAEAERDALRLRVTEDERDERSADAEIAKLRAEVAELRARPVLTVEALTEAIGATTSIGAGTRGRTIAGDIIAALGPVTLPSPDRAEELCRRYHDSTSTISIARGPAWSEYSDEGRAGRVSAMHKELTALAKLSPDPAPTFDAAFLRRVLVATKHGPNGKGGPGPCDAACVKCEAERMVKAAPAREVAPTLVAVSDEELATAYSVAHDQPIPRMAPLRDRTIAGIRAVRAKFGAAEVTEERLAGALAISIPPANGQRAKTCLELARDAIAYLRATAAKGGES